MSLAEKELASLALLRRCAPLFSRPMFGVLNWRDKFAIILNWLHEFPFQASLAITRRKEPLEVMNILTTPELAHELAKRKTPRPRGVSYLELAQSHELLGNRFSVDSVGTLINQTVHESIQAQMGVIVEWRAIAA